MHLAKPSWLGHFDDKNQRTSIFSVHVHPDGSRLATGGLDNKIKLWSTASIIDVNKANDSSVPRLLCTLGLHNGSVLCVRWSNKDGRYLASGSDDQLVLIWEWDRSTEGWSGGSVFGSGEHNIENWKPVRRLSGHQSDVVDLAWSKTNAYLASCGLDSLVFIWDGKTFEKLYKLDQHIGFVKGVTWDPVGEYLATESDDKTVKIWRTTDWSVQAEISEPYTSSPTTTFYRRLSWSPDGSHVATANGAQGAVPIAAIFNRGEWRTDISLVGHDSAIEVVAFNPVLFMIPDSDDADPNSATMGSVCAVGSQDHSISVWVTRNARPLFVCQKPFDHSVLDLAWSPDGTQLYACSYDGTVVVLQFLNKEFGTRVSEEEHEKLLTKYGFTAKEPIVLESTTQLNLESEYAIAKRKEKSDHMANMMEPMGSTTVDMDISTSEPSNNLTIDSKTTDFGSSSVPSQPLPSEETQQPINNEISTNINGASTSTSNTITSTAIHQQTVTMTKDGKRRIQPQFLRSSLTSSTTNMPSTSEQIVVESSTSNNGLTSASMPLHNNQKLTTEDILGSEMDAPSRALPPGGIPTLVIGNKRSAPSDTTSQSSKRQNISGKMQSEVEPQPSILRSSLVSPSVAMSQVRLATHKVLSYLAKDRLDGASLKLECYNFNENTPSQIMCTRGKTTVWFDYVPSGVILITGHSQYSAVACEDGSIYIYTAAGRRVLPVIMLESSASFLEICRDYLLVLTQVGLLSIWDLRNLKAIVHSVSIAPILSSASLNSDDFSSSVSIISAHVRSNGIPLLITSTNDAWCYHFDMHVWTRVYDPRYTSKDSTGSEVGEVNGGGILASLENYARQGGVKNLGSLSHLRRFSGNDTPGQPNHLIGYLENQLVSAELVNSPAEYKKLLFQYAQKIADEEAEYRLHELCIQLLGPTNNTEDFGSRAKSNWDPFLMGMSKRQLLEEVLTILSSNRSLQRHVTEYKNALNKILNLD